MLLTTESTSSIASSGGLPRAYCLAHSAIPVQVEGGCSFGRLPSGLGQGLLPSGTHQSGGGRVSGSNGHGLPGCHPGGVGGIGSPGCQPAGGRLGSPGC